MSAYVAIMQYHAIQYCIYAINTNNASFRTGEVLFEGRKLTEVGSFQELLESWEEAARRFIRLQVTMDNMIDLSMEELSPNSFVSCFVEDCIGRGKTIKAGGAVYDFCGPLLVGVANVGDSLAAIRKTVFEEGTLTAAVRGHPGGGHRASLQE